MRALGGVRMREPSEWDWFLFRAIPMSVVLLVLVFVSGALKGTGIPLPLAVLGGLWYLFWLSCGVLGLGRCVVEWFRSVFTSAPPGADTADQSGS